MFPVCDRLQFNIEQISDFLVRKTFDSEYFSLTDHVFVKFARPSARMFTSFCTLFVHEGIITDCLDKI